MQFDNQLFSKMVSEVKDCKKIQISGEKLQDMILSAFTHKPDVESNAIPVVAGNTYTYGQFSLEIPAKIAERLRSKASSEAILLMLSRLRTFGFQGQQWAIPAEWFQYLLQKFGPNILICFASPVNVQIYVPFCSLDEADKPFGSLGNFFELDLKVYMGNFAGKSLCATLNPSFTEEMLLAAFRRVEEMFELAHELKIELVVFFNGPYWNDAEFFVELNNCAYLRRAVKLEKGQHFYEDCFVDDAQNVVPGVFASQLWALSNYECDFSDMTTGFAKKVVVRKSDKQCTKCKKTFSPSAPHHKMCRDCIRRK